MRQTLAELTAELAEARRAVQTWTKKVEYVTTLLAEHNRAENRRVRAALLLNAASDLRAAAENPENDHRDLRNLCDIIARHATHIREDLKTEET